MRIGFIGLGHIIKEKIAGSGEVFMAAPLDGLYLGRLERAVVGQAGFIVI
jgi:hypothetical protein